MMICYWRKLYVVITLSSEIRRPMRVYEKKYDAGANSTIDKACLRN